MVGDGVEELCGSAAVEFGPTRLQISATFCESIDLLGVVKSCLCTCHGANQITGSRMDPAV